MFEKEESAEAGGASRPVVFSGGGGEVITRGSSVSSGRSPDESMRKIKLYVVLRPARSEREERTHSTATQPAGKD